MGQFTLQYLYTQAEITFKSLEAEITVNPALETPGDKYIPTYLAARGLWAQQEIIQYLPKY